MWNPLMLAAALLQTPVPQPTTAFVGATVLPMDSERRLEDHTVVVVDGRIVAVGPRASTPVPERALVIDAAGKFLMPGLTDMHVHTWSPADLPLFLANGVTTVRNMFGSPMHLAFRAQIAAGTLLGPTLVSAGPIVDGRPPVWPNSLVVTTPDEARAAVAVHVEAGYDFVKVYARLPREAYEALVEEARLAGIPIDGHVPEAVGLAGALAARQRTIEHLDGFGLRLRRADPAGATGWLAENLAWQDIDPARMDAAIAETLAAGTWLCPTFVVLQKWRAPDEFERELKLDHMRYVQPFVVGMWRQMNGNLSPELRAAGNGSLSGRMQFVKAFSDAGGRLILGTDMGNPLVVAGFALHEELANLIAAGLTPFQALSAGTRSAAECLGLPDEFGTLEVGKRADMLLLDADPLLDVNNAREPLGVMVRGRWLARAELAALLAALAPKIPTEEH